MNEDASTPPGMPEEIRRLQKHVRCLSRLLAVALLLGSLALWKAFESRSRKQEYVLVDSNGTPRAVMGVRDDKAFLSLFDAAGDTRVAVSSGAEDGPTLRLSSPDSKLHTMLMVRQEGSQLALLGGNNAGIRLIAGRQDARLHFLDTSGFLRLGMGTDDGLPFVGFVSTNMLSRMVVGDTEEGGRLSFFDSHGERRLSLGVYNDKPFLNPEPVQEDDR